jgi:exodeoxyribonuclease V gamma subunit
MRSIPFEVVVLLGMHDQAFPRLGTQAGFDAIAADPLLGDRSPRADDRGMFLESLLSARQRLEILYTGRGLRDNNVKPPAVPVGELLDALPSIVVRQHPLQPFSPEPYAYLDGESPTGFDRRMRDAARAWVDGLRKPKSAAPFLSEMLSEPAGVTDLSLAHLIRFLQHPTQWFCERRLGVWLRDEEDPVQDREPVLGPGALEHWALMDRLIRVSLEGRTIEFRGEVFTELERSGRLQMGTPGRVAWEGLRSEVAKIADRYSAHADGESFSVDIALDFDDLHLSGRVFDCHDSGRVCWRAGKVRAKYIIGMWVQHIAAAASGHLGQSHLFGRFSHHGASEISTDDAHAHLRALVAMYRMGQRTPLMFFPTCSEEWLRGFDNPNGGSPEWAGFNACKRFWGGFDEPGLAGHWILGHTKLPSGKIFPVNPFHPFADLKELPVPDGFDIEANARAVWPPIWDHHIPAPPSANP